MFQIFIQGFKVEGTSQYLVIILTPLLTLLANYIFYRFIKADVDKKIHQNNIAFSGIFQEKIKVYRQLLEKIYDLRLLINLYDEFETKEDTKTTALHILEFTKFYEINRPFISDAIHQASEKLRETFTLLHQMRFNNLEDDEGKIDIQPILKEVNTKTLEKIEKRLVREMKKQLKTL